jgi:cell wall assembly regulator SMI1
MAKLVELRATLRLAPSTEAITKAEQALQSRFPDGIREFYKCCDGVEDSTAQRVWDFFSLKRMIERTLDRDSRSPFSSTEARSCPTAAWFVFVTF